MQKHRKSKAKPRHLKQIPGFLLVREAGLEAGEGAEQDLCNVTGTKLTSSYQGTECLGNGECPGCEC